jgi:hypothetical protein
LAQSSRSHLIFTILLEHTNLTLGTRATSKLTFVDLAGSERVGRSGAINDKVTPCFLYKEKSNEEIDNYAHYLYIFCV